VPGAAGSHRPERDQADRFEGHGNRFHYKWLLTEISRRGLAGRLLATRAHRARHSLTYVTGISKDPTDLFRVRLRRIDDS
jgi:hypothetical protein